MKREGFQQCLLRNGIRYKTAWIPRQFAIQGKWLRILNEDHWRVVVAYKHIDAQPSIPHGYFAGGVFHK